MDKILIIDFGSQYTQLIARRIRECQVFSVIERPEKVNLDYIHKEKPKGIILSGGPVNVYKKNAPRLYFDPLKINCPILGVCYGFQLLVHHLGGTIKKANKKEYGETIFHLLSDHALFKDIPKKHIRVWMSHGDGVLSSDTFSPLGNSTSHKWSAGIYKNNPNIIGLQFHPEVSHTEFGNLIFKNFVSRITQAKKQWQTGDIINSLTKEIRNTVGKKRVIHGLSGGVDSTTLAYLLHKAIGNRLRCYFIDHGLHRQNEAEEFRKMSKGFPFPCHIIKTRAFLDALKNLKSGEKKREAIGKCFANFFKPQTPPNEFLAHGTLYPDTIETDPQVGQSDKIKTHHNRSRAYKDLPLLEPFRLLFKDEVRAIAKKLGVPKKIIQRQPFPGPGLSVRIEGKVTPRKLKILREADAIFRKEIEKHPKRHNLGQYFTVLQNSYSVGIRGDERHRGPVVMLVAIKSENYMTASAAELPWRVLRKTATQITNEIEEINRVTYSLSDKPPATIEFI